MSWDKRLFDVVGSSVGIILLSPIFALIAVAIKLDSSGEVFFRQTRVGKGGHHFQVYKFRTMISNQSKTSAQITIMGDARITKIGKTLRHFKLDELPQLLNVFKNEMSLVGPRPEVPKYMKFYSKNQRNLILSVQPGITDLAAIEFRNESELLSKSEDPNQTYIQEIMPIKFKYYEKYIHNMSVTADIKIIINTIIAILK